MITLFEPAYAKVNLTLDVLCKRPDGYHDLKSVMQTISLQDDVEIDVETGKPWMLRCSQPDIPTDERNLAWKAAKLFFDQIHKDPDGLEIRITKRIPSEAGMGGGSSDAAAVLRALNRHYNSPYSLMELADLGAAIGSDVPFCVLCGTAMAEGRGEKLRKLPDMAACYFVVCKPEFSSSTPELYRKLDASEIMNRPDNDAMEQALQAGNLEEIGRNIHNVFDPVVSAEHCEVDEIKAVFENNGCVGQQMTGSGSAVYGVTANYEDAERIQNILRKCYQKVYIAKPV